MPFFIIPARGYAEDDYMLLSISDTVLRDGIFLNYRDLYLIKLIRVPSPQISNSKEKL